MPSIRVTVAHDRGQQPAIERLQGFMDILKIKYQGHFDTVEETWEDNQLRYAFRALGMAVRGVMAVEAEQVQLDAELPFAALLFKGRIEREIREALERTLR